MSVVDPLNYVEESDEGNNIIWYEDNELFLEAPKTCTDANEPNNSFAETHSFGSLFASTTYACFSNSDDKEYFKVSNAGNSYFIGLEIQGLNEPLEYSLNYKIGPDNLLEIKVSLGYESSFAEAEIFLYDGTQKLITKNSTSSNELNLNFVLPKDEETSTSISKEDSPELEIYPNPTKDALKINTKINFTKVEVFNSLGKPIPIEIENNKINLEGLKPGIYFLKVYYENKYVIRNFVKL